MAEDHNAQGPTTGVAPHLTIPSRGGQAAIEFYTKAFGAEERIRHLAEDGERVMHAHLRINGGSVMLNDEFPEYNGEQDIAPKGVTLHMQVDDADEWWNVTPLGAISCSPLYSGNSSLSMTLPPLMRRWACMTRSPSSAICRRSSSAPKARV